MPCPLLGAAIVLLAARKTELALYLPFRLGCHDMSPLSGNHRWLFLRTTATYDLLPMVALCVTQNGLRPFEASRWAVMPH